MHAFAPAFGLLALLTSAAGAATDVRHRRIPNVLTFGFAFAAVLVRTVLFGVADGAAALLVAAGVLVAGSLLFERGWLGGGDVKLLAADAAAFGTPDVLPLVVFTALAGGVMALAVAASQRRLRRTMLVSAHAFALGGHVESDARYRSLPYAIAICAGCALVLLSHTLLPMVRLPL